MSSIDNLKTVDPFAEADEDTGETKQSQNYIHIRIQQRNGRKTLTTVQGLPKKFNQKKILKVIKKKFVDTEMGEVIQLQGDQRKDVQEFLVDKEGLELDSKTIKQAMFGIFRLPFLKVSSSWSSSFPQGRAFSRVSPRRKQSTNEPSYLKGARSPERSIRVMSKENARMPSDVGLLEKTFITPTGNNRPSLLKSPLSVLKLEKTRILTRARDVLSLFICKFSSPKAKGFWDRSFNLDRSSLVPNATALHRQMYTAFSEGDDITLQSICLDGIRDKFRSRIANRPREERVVWEFIKYNKKPRLISNRAAKTPINGIVLRQAVVQICSRQKLTRYTMKKNGTLEQIQGTGKEKDVIEYVVIQRIYEQWQPLNWMIWGTTKEITMKDIEEWNQI